VRRNHRRPRVPRAHQRSGFSAGHQIGGDPDRRARLSAQRLSRRLGHPDHVRCLDHPNIELAEIFVARKLRPDPVGRADQIHADSEVASGGQGAVHNPTRRMIAAHRVNGYSHLAAISYQLSAISDSARFDPPRFKSAGIA
jgi:hypothetical protein